MLEYNKIINDIMFTQSESLFLFIIFALLFSLAFDAVIGELGKDTSCRDYRIDNKFF